MQRYFVTNPFIRSFRSPLLVLNLKDLFILFNFVIAILFFHNNSLIRAILYEVHALNLIGRITTLMCLPPLLIDLHNTSKFNS
jgi:hypothetical protein